MNTIAWRYISVVLGSVIFSLGMVAPADAQSVWKIFSDGFESGDVTRWETKGAGCAATTSAKRTGYWGLNVNISDGEHYSFKRDLDEIFNGEISFSFDFDPNGASIPVAGSSAPGNSIQIATLFSSAPRKVMAALYARRSGTGGYTAYLAWEEADGIHYTHDTSGEFPLPDAWSRITMALHVDSWIKVWVDEGLASEIIGVDHAGANVQTAAIGKIWSTSNGPAGTLHFDNARVELPRIDDLWVDAAQTNCAARDGLSRTEAFCTIQEAADLAGPGATVHILNGTYNEHVTPSYSGENEGEYTTYQAETAGAVTIDGSGLGCDGVYGVFEIHGSGAVKKYLEIIGLSIENPITAAGCDRDGIYINGGMNILISGTSVSDSSGLTPVNADAVGVYIVNSENVTVLNSSFYNTRSSAIRFMDSSDVIIDGNDVRKAVNGGTGECVAAANGAIRFEIRNNTIHDGAGLQTGGSGIDVKNGACCGGVYDNIIHDLPGETHIYVDGYNNGVHDVEVYGNIVNCYPEGGTGIALSSEKGGLLTGIRLYNNVVYDCRGAGIEVTNWDNDGMKTHIGIHNNTIHHNGLQWGGGVFVSSDNIQDVVISNNIASQNHRWQIGVQPPDMTEVSGSRNLVHGDLDEGVPDTADCDWNECFEFAGSLRIIAAPGFESTVQGSYDFHLISSSPAIDAGSYVLVDPDGNGIFKALSFDHEWTERPLDGDMDYLPTPDRGAHEFDPYEEVDWTGNTDEDWNTSSNWNPPVVPGHFTRAIIPDVTGASGRFPTASGSPPQSAGVIDVRRNASLAIDSHPSLQTFHKLIMSGYVEITGALNLE